MKYTLLILALIILAAAGYWYSTQSAKAPSDAMPATTTSAPEGSAVVPDGTYTVQSEQSRVEWAGKKPLVEGYINSGSIGVSGGTIMVAGQEVSGDFTLDMNTLSVGSTPAKPGQERALEGHLKGERWFAVATHPTASFIITQVSARADSDTTLMYDVTGDLTLKGQTSSVTFPATIYLAQDGMLHAHGTTEIDRTKWGITAGSDSFFDNLADNVIDDMVALSFTLIAQKQ